MGDRVIVVGAGLAGIVAAYAAQEAGAEVLVLDRSGAGLGTNSALANGVFAGPGPEHSSENYVSDTIRIGKNLNCRWMVERMAAEAEDSFEFIRPLGFEWTTEPGLFTFREGRPDMVRGAQMMRALAHGLAGQPGVRVESGFQVTEILRHEGRAAGVAGWDRQGRPVRLGADAVVLATGGAGALYACNDNQKGALGQGYALAARAGLELWDLEFVQFYPLVLAEPKLSAFMLYPNYPPETRVVNDHGEDLVVKYGMGNMNEAILQRRDEFSARLFAENREGQVFLDFTRVPEAAWSGYPMAMLSKFKFDFRNKPVAISPGAHFFMGGVPIDEQGQTSLPGLFACGEVVGGLHGANRRGGNALTECVVFGRLAGAEAARAAQSESSPLVSREEGGVSVPTRGSGPSGLLKELRLRLRENAWLRAGIVRSRRELEQGRGELAAWEEELAAFEPRSLAEAKAKEDLECGALVLKGIIAASLAREESRGAFLCEEFPDTDDERWRKHSCLTYDVSGREFTLRHEAVV
jgi:succinate dehydrogenase/fumarate reductase flavoprotein subunit